MLPIWRRSGVQASACLRGDKLKLGLPTNSWRHKRKEVSAITFGKRYRREVMGLEVVCGRTFSRHFDCGAAWWSGMGYHVWGEFMVVRAGGGWGRFDSATPHPSGTSRSLLSMFAALPFPQEGETRETQSAACCRSGPRCGVPSERINLERKMVEQEITEETESERFPGID